MIKLTLYLGVPLLLLTTALLCLVGVLAQHGQTLCCPMPPWGMG